LIKNSQPFGKKFQKTVGGDFFLTHTVSVAWCIAICHSGIGREVQPKNLTFYYYQNVSIINYDLLHA